MHELTRPTCSHPLLRRPLPSPPHGTHRQGSVEAVRLCNTAISPPRTAARGNIAAATRHHARDLARPIALITYADSSLRQEPGAVPRGTGARDSHIRKGTTTFRSDRGASYPPDELDGYATSLDVKRSIGRAGTGYDSLWPEFFDGP